MTSLLQIWKGASLIKKNCIIRENNSMTLPCLDKFGASTGAPKKENRDCVFYLKGGA